MSKPSETQPEEEIARIATAIWEADGRPEGRDHEHWTRAKQLFEEGRAASDVPEVAGAREPDDRPPGLHQSVAEDTAPEMFPYTKNALELPKEPDDRNEKLRASARDGDDFPPEQIETPGPRNPPPLPPTNAKGFAVIPSIDEAAAGAVSGDPQPPHAAGDARSGGRRPVASDAKSDDRNR